jgi:protein gp37
MLCFDGQGCEWGENHGWPIKNVWLGVSVEDQQTADERIPLLLQTPAAVRFISAEPLLGPIRLNDGQSLNYSQRLKKGWSLNMLQQLDWIICGGESGPNARPMHPNWARSLRDQCQAAGVPFFFKQWGAHTEDGRRIGKKAAGRVLDGRTWEEFPFEGWVAVSTNASECALCRSEAPATPPLERSQHHA